MVHPKKISLAEIWGSIRFFISDFFFVFHFDHFQDLGFETIIDGAKGENTQLGKISLGQQNLNHSQSLQGIKLANEYENEQ